MNHAESIAAKLSLPEPKPEAVLPSTSEKKWALFKHRGSASQLV